jgi:hypothetical protein
MTPRELEEYRALRATIRERGTARIWILVAGLAVWSGLTVATAALAALPVATLLPLLVLAGVFQAIFALHVGVERVGRYVQVYFETEGGWEHAAMDFGRAQPAVDPLFVLVFVGATVINFIPVLLAEPTALELGITGAVHVAFVARLFVAHRQASRQRSHDLARFQQMKSGELPR